MLFRSSSGTRKISLQQAGNLCAGVLSSLACRRKYLSQVGSWSKINGTSCYPACNRYLVKYASQVPQLFFSFFLTRQTNKLEISNVRFPNLEFVDRPEFWSVARKLFWSCYQAVSSTLIGPGLTMFCSHWSSS